MISTSAVRGSQRIPATNASQGSFYTLAMHEQFLHRTGPGKFPPRRHSNNQPHHADTLEDGWHTGRIAKKDHQTGSSATNDPWPEPSGCFYPQDWTPVQCLLSSSVKNIVAVPEKKNGHDAEKVIIGTTPERLPWYTDLVPCLGAREPRELLRRQMSYGWTPYG